MPILPRFALLFTLCLFATSGFALPAPVASVPRPDVQELVGTNRVTVLGKPVDVPRAPVPIQPPALPFRGANPDLLPIVPFAVDDIKRDPMYTNEIMASSPLKIVKVESDHMGKKPPLSARAVSKASKAGTGVISLPEVDIDAVSIGARDKDTTFGFATPLHVVKGNSHGYSDSKRATHAPAKAPETGSSSASLPQLGAQAAQIDARSTGSGGSSSLALPATNMKLASITARKQDETLDATAPAHVVHLQDHKYEDSDPAGPPSLPLKPPAIPAPKPPGFPILGARKTDETTDVTAPAHAAELQDHKYHERAAGKTSSDDNGSASFSLPQSGVQGPQLSARKHDQTTHIDTLLGGAASYHPYSDDRKRDGSELSARKHDQTTHLGTVAGGFVDYHPYTDERKREGGELSARKHDQTTHADTLLGGSLDYHPYSDNKKRSKDQTVQEDVPLNGGADYHKYSDKRASATPSVPKLPKGSPKLPARELGDYTPKVKETNNGKSEDFSAPSPNSHLPRAGATKEELPKSSVDTLGVEGRTTPEWMGQ